MRRNDQPSRPNAMTCSRFSLLKTWLMTTEANFPLRQLCLKPSLYGRFSLDHLWPLLGDHRGCLLRTVISPESTCKYVPENSCQGRFSLITFASSLLRRLEMLSSICAALWITSPIS